MNSGRSYTYNPPKDYDEAVAYAEDFAKVMMDDWSLRLFDITAPRRGARVETEHLVITNIHDRSKVYWLNAGETLSSTGYHQFKIN